MLCGRKRLSKAARVAKIIGLGLFYLALAAALTYSVLSPVQAGAP
ncbi:MAG: hypothetical protein PVG79_04140 [Gemmatimonadales bacterium]|jgi:hypothetical protein